MFSHEYEGLGRRAIPKVEKIVIEKIKFPLRFSTANSKCFSNIPNLNEVCPNAQRFAAGFLILFIFINDFYETMKVTLIHFKIPINPSKSKRLLLLEKVAKVEGFH